MLIVARAFKAARRSTKQKKCKPLSHPAPAPRRFISSEILSFLVSESLKSALNDTAESIRPHVGWMNPGLLHSGDFTSPSRLPLYVRFLLA